MQKKELCAVPAPVLDTYALTVCALLTALSVVLALAVGAVGTWIYIGGVDSDLWGRAALGAGMFLLALVAKKIGDYVEECREEQEEREEERRDEVFAAWIRSGSLKEG